MVKFLMQEGGYVTLTQACPTIPSEYYNTCNTCMCIDEYAAACHLFPQSPGPAQHGGPCGPWPTQFSGQVAFLLFFLPAAPLRHRASRQPGANYNSLGTRPRSSIAMFKYVLHVARAKFEQERSTWWPLDLQSSYIWNLQCKAQRCHESLS